MIKSLPISCAYYEIDKLIWPFGQESFTKFTVRAQLTTISQLWFLRRVNVSAAANGKWSNNICKLNVISQLPSLGCACCTSRKPILRHAFTVAVNLVSQCWARAFFNSTACHSPVGLGLTSSGLTLPMWPNNMSSSHATPPVSLLC